MEVIAIASALHRDLSTNDIFLCLLIGPASTLCINEASSCLP